MRCTPYFLNSLFISEPDCQTPASGVMLSFMMDRDNPIPADLPLVERAYLEGIRKMGPMGRVQRTCSLFQSIVGMIRHQIELENPGLSEREVRIRAAERMYASEPEVLKLLERARHL